MGVVRYHKDLPYHATLKERRRLNKRPSSKETYHLELDLGDSGISYSIGDCVAILPQNDPDRVSRTLEALGATGEELLRHPRKDQQVVLKEYLTHSANLCDVPKSLLRAIREKSASQEKREWLTTLLEPTSQESLLSYLNMHEVWDLLKAHPEAEISAEELLPMLSPLLPRFYSISSSMKVVGKEVHLTVVEEPYLSNGHMRRGVCSHYLCYHAPLGEPSIRIYHHPSRGFTLPEGSEDFPLIMVGPGTGVAPFRGFMQERIFHGASSKNWLFFGECHRDNDFFYEEFWSELVDKKQLIVDLAFSRDQEEKFYVQHRMLERGGELWRWLEEGAYFFVCGSAAKMAKEVDIALHKIIEEHGKLSELEARGYVKRLKESRRYLRDVY